MASTIKSGSNNDLYIQTDGVDRIVVDSNGNTSVTGNVGIGTASPTVPLHVTDSGTFIGGIESTTAYAYLGLRDLNSGGSMADPTVGVGAQTNDLAFRAGGAERVRIDANGYVTMPYQPKFLVGFTTTGQISVPDANVIPFNYTGGQGTFDVGSNFNTSTSRFTAPVAGHYFLQANITAVTSSTVSAQIMKNGAAITNGGDTMASFINGINNSATMNTTLIVYLAVGDYVDARTRNATYNVYKNHTWFLGYLIG